MRSFLLRTAVAIGVIVGLGISRVHAAHLDVLTVDVGGRLTTGTTSFDSNPPVTSLGVRVFTQSFDSFYAINNPGFSAVGTSTGTPPAGASALPGGRALRWDFLPMEVGGVTSNLLYWNGAGTTAAQVAFGAAPGADYSLTLFGKNSGDVAAARGEPSLVTGGVVETTEADGRIHAHRYFFLDNDTDGGNATAATPGVYLVALRLRMTGLNRSAPFYVAFGTPGASLAALGAAASWVGARADALAPNFSADFDGDLDVDGDDLLAWQRGVGSGALQIGGDANGDHAVTAADLAIWREQFGQSVATFAGAPAATAAANVPEPGGGLLGLGAVLWGAVRVRARRLATGRRAPDPLPNSGGVC